MLENLKIRESMLDLGLRTIPPSILKANKILFVAQEMSPEEKRAIVNRYAICIMRRLKALGKNFFFYLNETLYASHV